MQCGAKYSSAKNWCVEIINCFVFIIIGSGIGICYFKIIKFLSVEIISLDFFVFVYSKDFHIFSLNSKWFMENNVLNWQKVKINSLQPKAGKSISNFPWQCPPTVYYRFQTHYFQLYVRKLQVWQVVYLFQCKYTLLMKA